ncbi:glycosyltransferase family 2 protein [Geobacter sp.]|uniref:glycosyltransferase family 2 protein n=1 Tax=Geobacter sp. TaxID=46610 RepID=UPI00260F8868|nr:glycosyltransferase family 2 protein [Geobacter sp.]
MEYIFAASLFLVFHAYFGYPLTLRLLRYFRRKTVTKAPFEPPATLIITACNEERRIRDKLENTIVLDYPRERLQVLVASDGSTDNTNDVVRSYAHHGIELLAFPERRGKESAQKDAVLHATGEVIVFSDVATFIEPHGLKEIIANFADPSVGCVSSVDRVIGRDGKPCGEGFYVRYEMWLRDLESQVNSLVGLSGSFFAARREVCRDFSGEMQSDFRTVLNSMRLGLRGVSDSDTIGYYQDISDSKREFDRKVRTVLRGLTVFFRNLEFLNPLRYGLFSYQYFCHKLLRWLVPLFLLAALAANAALSLDSVGYSVLLLLHLAFYGTAVGGWLAKSPPSHAVLKIPLYFVTVNAAILVAWWRYIGGKRMVMWAPSER